MLNIKVFSLFLLIILLFSGCGVVPGEGGSGTGEGPVGEIGTAGYYVPTANSNVSSGYVLFSVLGTTVEATNGKIKSYNPQSTWIYCYWKESKGKGMGAITEYNSATTVYAFTEEYLEEHLPESIDVTTEALEGWNIDSPAALQVAETNGGSTFRNSDTIVYPSIGSSPSDYDFPVWVVMYKNGPDRLYCFVNATTGEFITSEATSEAGS